MRPMSFNTDASGSSWPNVITHVFDEVPGLSKTKKPRTKMDARLGPAPVWYLERCICSFLRWTSSRVNVPPGRAEREEYDVACASASAASLAWPRFGKSGCNTDFIQ